MAVTGKGGDRRSNQGQFVIWELSAWVDLSVNFLVELGCLYHRLSSEPWYFPNVCSDTVFGNPISSLPSWLGDMKAWCWGGWKSAWLEASSCHLFSELLCSPHVSQVSSPLLSVIHSQSPGLEGPQCPRPSPTAPHGRPVMKGGASWKHISRSGHQDLARRQFLSSPQDFVEVILNLENEGLKALIYVLVESQPLGGL